MGFGIGSGRSGLAPGTRVGASPITAVLVFVGIRLALGTGRRDAPGRAALTGWEHGAGKLAQEKNRVAPAIIKRRKAGI
jgi:hypothetical protein